MSEKRGGFQKDGTYVQEIIRQTNHNGRRGYFPPEEGHHIITRSGPFLVIAILEVFRVGKRIFFRAEGLLDSREK